ncbi:hypothetical protein Sjap_009483 [Stephania japonica]|uniref:Uncharacterized protein n=1 Tax=Stephania japonica TaxID=461633 RepID=A0AAP0JS85_9MAGN
MSSTQLLIIHFGKLFSALKTFAISVSHFFNTALALAFVLLLVEHARRKAGRIPIRIPRSGPPRIKKIKTIATRSTTLSRK